MHLVRFDPFTVLRDVDRVLGGGRPNTWAPRVDVVDREDGLLIRIEAAGMDADGVDVTVEDRTLTVSGTRAFGEADDAGVVRRREIPSGEFARTIVLPEDLDAAAIAATMDRGLLEISVPRRPEVLPRKVEVEVAG